MLRQLARAPRFALRFARASRSLAYAERQGTPGTMFARFGRQLGIRLLRRRSALGLSYLVTPVNITRYFEFEFAATHIPPASLACLDVSSPRLLSLFIASAHPAASIEMLNPDVGDAGTTEVIAHLLGYSNIAVSSKPVSALAGRQGSYDCIWSISVVEHIGGDTGDSDAMRLMYAALRPGGRLIVTVPVDRRFWHEYRDRDYYGMPQPPTPSGEYFFQRLYDESNLRARLIEPLRQEPREVSWFGERVAGTFHAYERRWIELGPSETVEDARRIADDYDEYPSWGDMPGFGVCGMVFVKPPDDDQGRAS
jgi:SAM-dependent methyltransferase